MYRVKKRHDQWVKPPTSDWLDNWQWQSLFLFFDDNFIDFDWLIGLLIGWLSSFDFEDFRKMDHAEVNTKYNNPVQ